MPFCSRCGREIPPDATFCMHCGIPVTASIPPPPAIPSPSIKVSHVKRNVIIVVILVLLFGIIAATLSRPGPEKITSQIVVSDYKISIDRVGVDEVHIGSVVLRLRNEGNAIVKTSKLVISSGGESIEDYEYTTVEPGKEQELSFGFLDGRLGKGIGVESINATMKLFGYIGMTGDEQVLVEKGIAISIQRFRIGDTIPEVAGSLDRHKLSLTLLWWKESDIAVEGPYIGGTYYTFKAKPGMKFIILAYRFQNNWIREQETPYFDAGEIATDKGYIYSVWHSPSGTSSEEYKPREATSEEIGTLLGDSGAFENLLPGQSCEGRVVFEIPADTTPIEASLVYVSSLIAYQ